MSNWLEKVLSETDEAESPKAFLLWGGLVAISAIMRRNVWVQKGKLYKLYPNVYVMLIARSGGRKGFPVSLSRKLVEEVGNTRIINGRSSIQAIIQDLGTAFSVEGRPPIVDAHALLSFPEFGSSLVDDPDALTILTDLYDSHAHDTWTNNLKSSGKTQLKLPCITILAASNEAHFHDKVGETSVLGGFIARTILVDEKKKSRINPLIDDSGSEINIKDLAKYLIELSKLTGQFAWSPSAKELYKEWYNDFSNKLEDQEKDDPTGTSDRIHDTIIKTSMLLSLADKPELIIEKGAVNAAIELCLKSAGDAGRITQGRGKSESAEGTRIVVNEIAKSKAGNILRTELLRRHYGTFDSNQLDRIAETLVQAEMIEVVGTGRSTTYVAKEKMKTVVDYWNKKKEEK